MAHGTGNNSASGLEFSAELSGGSSHPVDTVALHFDSQLRHAVYQQSLQLHLLELPCGLFRQAKQPFTSLYQAIRCEQLFRYWKT
jgi:hypothetical protein